MIKADERVELIGKFATTLSLIEIGLGSLLHSFHVPFAGVFLSLNQGFLLTRAALDTRALHEKWLPYQISNVAAVLKSFSPAGKKLGPMLSLSMQGLLFNLGVFVFGVNTMGLSLGMVLLSFWGFCQPILTFYLFFGEDLFKAFDFMLTKILPYPDLVREILVKLVILVIIVKALVGILIVFFATRSEMGLNFQQKMMEVGLRKKQSSTRSQDRPFILALKDLCRPLFLVSFFMTGFFAYYTEHTEAELCWILLRPLGVGFIFFYFSRTLTVDRWLVKMENGRGKNFAMVAKNALEKVRSVL